MADLDDLDNFLRLLPGSVRRYITPALFAGANKIQVAAQISITEGAVSGAGHVASLPGEAPNNDTGVLANNIETVMVTPLKAEVSSNAPYALKLEFGGSNPNGSYVEERPYMRPAARKEEDNARKLVARALKAAVLATRRRTL